ncbi:cell wall elongation regulator TseB-like domain-containing protein [Bacillus sp. USDA818B3_A]|uniref:cell wall elongation regulator TseB-like domain-containing protein n=1 Tax=Bacillus sp. USDA818B3_A TaxID=2698834 RepID=UPI00136EA040|nr:DUF5590 domain-containing protein [Bacillus sp. USDA818B3_A]
MKKWIVIPLLVVLVISALLVKVYFSSVQPVRAAEKKAVSVAKDHIQFSEIDDFHIYNGNETVSVIEGKNKQGDKVIVWIPDKSKKVFTKKAADGITKEDAIQKLLQEKQPKKIISVRLGMEKNIPLWEIYYRSENNLINYYYVHFETGEWLKKIENL